MKLFTSNRQLWYEVLHQRALFFYCIFQLVTVDWKAIEKSLLCASEANIHARFTDYKVRCCVMNRGLYLK